ncbi:MAG: hypothetical protein SPE11_02100 [Parabacteroides sp.]|nr:hypothetical protein [Parabacteroides sp.]
MLFESQTPILVASNMVLLTIIYYSLQPAYYQLEKNPPARTYLGIFCIFLFVMFSFWILDWFGYQTTYYQIRESEFFRTRTHLETVYVWIAMISPDYLIFRLIVFGGAFLFVYLIFKHLEVDQDLVWFFFGVLFLPLFAYARVSLAVVIMFYGAVLICKPFPYRKSLSYLLGVFFIIVSVFFHKSAALGTLVVVFSLISPNANKNAWFYLLVGFVVAVVVMRIAVELVLGGALSGDEDMSSMGQHYLGQQSSGQTGLGSIVAYTVEWTPYYMVAYLSFLIQSEYEVPKHIEFVLKFDMYLVLMASIFGVDVGANTSLMHLRLLRFSLVPNAIVLAYAYQYGLFNKYVRIVFFLGLLCVIYRLTYTFYNSLVMN